MGHGRGNKPGLLIDGLLMTFRNKSLTEKNFNLRGILTLKQPKSTKNLEKQLGHLFIAMPCLHFQSSQSLAFTLESRFGKIQFKISKLN